MIFSKNGPIRSFKRKIRERWRWRGNPEEVFTRIYNRNIWGSKESVSGTGSELQATTKIREEIPALVKEYEVKRLLDVPCGDYNWMKYVVPKLDVEYIGGDIVRPIIQENNRRWGSDGVSFIHIDLTCDHLPRADLMLVRDCLFHLSHEAIYRFLENFCRSDIKYLLTTTFVSPYLNDKAGINSDCMVGSDRPLYLHNHPFCFPEPLNIIVEDELFKNLLLFDYDQILVARNNMKQNLQSMVT
ncbi:MAG: class I SAM-dependent methyltransferase [Paracoccaceae bacterium]|nr:class I SAM-dependent methyltransferase [Paracoccaceae bacterium]